MKNRQVVQITRPARAQEELSDGSRSAETSGTCKKRGKKPREGYKTITQGAELQVLELGAAGMEGIVGDWEDSLHPKAVQLKEENADQRRRKVSKKG